MKVHRRVPSPAVALESTLLLHGVPSHSALGLHRELCELCVQAGAHPALVALLEGAPVAGVTEAELQELLQCPSVPKANTSNLGVLKYWGANAATTVSATMEIAAAAGINVFATGGLGGVHQNLFTGSATCNLDISSDLAAMSRFPVAVVSSGVKSILDVVATREALESLGVCVVGFQTDSFPAFYQRASDAGVDARFDDVQDLAGFLLAEFARSNRAVLVANPIPEQHEIPHDRFEVWREQATEHAESIGATGRALTPAILAALHRISDGATLNANIELIRSNTTLAAQIASAMHQKNRNIP
ncbi:MAG: pseudouridine-5'-phosphate glycosidase [Phycisphaerales bacterium JB065]